jgi:hypothetical protein
MDSVAEYYLEQLTTNDNKVAVLVNFYKRIFNLDTVSADTFSRFGSLVKLFGAFSVYKALLDCATAESIDITHIFGLLVYICKKRLFEDNTYFSNNLTKLAKDTENNLNKKRKNIRIPGVEL